MGLLTPAASYQHSTGTYHHCGGMFVHLVIPLYRVHKRYLSKCIFCRYLYKQAKNQEEHRNFFLLKLLGYLRR